MERRFIRNIPTITEAQQSLLRTKCAAIIGCGGLGGYAAEMLARSGVGALTVCDGDMFEESNLNRQNLALPGNLGQNKALAAAERIRAIDEGIALRAFPEHFTAENAGEILAGVDIVIDALDSVPSRILLEDECAGRKLPTIILPLFCGKDTPGSDGTGGVETVEKRAESCETGRKIV